MLVGNLVKVSLGNCNHVGSEMKILLKYKIVQKYSYRHLIENKLFNVFVVNINWKCC